MEGKRERGCLGWLFVCLFVYLVGWRVVGWWWLWLLLLVLLLVCGCGCGLWAVAVAVAVVVSDAG